MKTVKVGFEKYNFYIIIIFLSLLSFAMCFGSFYLADKLSEEALEERIKKADIDNIDTARFVEENIRQVLSKDKMLLLLMKQDIEKSGYISSDRLDLLGDNIKESSFHDIIVTDRDGNVISSAPTSMKNISNMENFQWHQQNDSEEMYIGHFQASSQAIFISIRVNDINRQFAGIVSAAISQKIIAGAYSDLNLEEGSTIVLLRQDGSYIFRFPEVNSDERVEKFYRSHPAIAKVAAGDIAGTYEKLSEVDGVLRLGAFRLMKGYPLVILATTSKAAALQEVLVLKKNYQYMAMVISALILLSLSVALWQMYSQRRMTLALKEKQAQLEYTSQHDNLTGLFNRHFLQSVVEKEIAYADRYGTPLSMILFDLDHFKKVNDTWGHPIGDSVLKKTAEIAKGLVRESDIVARIGGEEFIIILPNKDDSDSLVVAERIRMALEKNKHNLVGQVTASFGVVRRTRSEPFLRCYRRLDEALYRAKQEGRNRVVEATNRIDSLMAFAKLEWQDKYESGNLGIDHQHRKLVEAGNQLIDVSTSGADFEDVIKILEKLMEDISQHFKYEEKVLQEIGYPYYEEHKQIHQALVKKVFDLKEDYLNGQSAPADFFSLIVDDFIIGHMFKEDIKFFAYTS